MVNVAVDAMGGDNAPYEVVKGAIQALNENSSIKVWLCGVKEDMEKALSGLLDPYDTDRLKLVECSEVIETGEPPVNAIRKKKDSSIVKGLSLVKDGSCDAFVSAGSSGAVLVGGQFIVGRIKGVSEAGGGVKVILVND